MSYPIATYADSNGKLTPFALVKHIVPAQRLEISNSLYFLFKFENTHKPINLSLELVVSTIDLIFQYLGLLFTTFITKRRKDDRNIGIHCTICCNYWTVKMFIYMVL